MGNKRIGLNIQNSGRLLARIDHYYALSVDIVGEFGGPSLYFHQEAVKVQKSDFLSFRHLEMMYATLASWGMHRMGDPEETKAKLVEFDEFRNSILNQRERLNEYKEYRFEEISNERYLEIFDDIKDVFLGLRISISNTILVANAKTLAHILPDLFPPLDRNFIVRFFTQDESEFFKGDGKYRTIQIPSGNERQFEMFKDLCNKIKELFGRCDKKLFCVNGVGFNTSYPKIMDNLIVAYVKSVPRPKS